MTTPKGHSEALERPHKPKLSDIPKVKHHRGGLHTLESGGSREQKCKLNTDS